MLSPVARSTYDTLKGAARRRVNDAIARIEADPGWTDGRFLAPAWSEHHGALVDFSASPYAITYRVIDKGAVIWILSVRPVIF